MAATRAAAEEGIAPGGGTVLIRSSDDLKKVKTTDEFQTGVNILMKALEEPVRVIANNSGAEGAVVLAGVSSGKGNYGYDAATDTFGDMIELGIIEYFNSNSIILIEWPEVINTILPRNVVYINFENIDINKRRITSF